VQISNRFGDASVWPGDTIGISVLSGAAADATDDPSLAVSWGSALGNQPHPRSAIFEAAVSVN
jgi:hypothetical protein